MSLVIALFLGALVGYVANRIGGRQAGFWFSALTGIVGALLGNLISYVLGGGKVAFLAFDLSGLLWSLGGAILFVFLLNKLQKRKA